MTKNSNQAPNSNKRKLSISDIILMLLGIFILIRTPWSNMNSFYYLLFFLYIFCIMMRITNLRKQNEKKEEMLRKKAEEEAQIHALEENEATQLSSTETPVTEEISSPAQENKTHEENHES